MAAWGTLCSLEEEQEVGKVRTPVWDEASP